MTSSRYERYVVRNPTPPDPSIQWGLPELGIPSLYHFLKSSGPIKESNTMVEYAWIVKDSAFGVTLEKPPHKHDCAEIFMFMGTDSQNNGQLNAEVEFWMGEGEETEKVSITTSTLVFVPEGVLHLPLFFKKVKKPILWIVVALNIGKALESTLKYPVRGV